MTLPDSECVLSILYNIVVGFIPMGQCRKLGAWEVGQGMEDETVDCDARKVEK